MTTPRKLARQRAARRRQEENMKNLQRGAEEHAAAQQANPATVNPDDPQGLVKSSGGANVRVVSAPGVEPTKKSASGTSVVGSGSKTISNPATVTGVEGKQQRRPGYEVKVVGQRRSKSWVSSQQQAGTQTIGGRVVSGPRPSSVQPKSGVGTAPQPNPQQAPQQLQAQQQAAAPAMPPMQVQPSNAPRGDVTVILTCFERPALFRRQLDALRSQTLQPGAIMAWVNAGQVGHDERALSGSGVLIIRANANLGPWTRFTLAYETNTEYVCILDDDTIPGPKWIESCMKRLSQAEAMSSGEEGDLGTYCIASAGEIFRSDDPNDRYFVGPESPRPEELEVDIGRNGWFFRRDLIHAFLNHPRVGDGRIGWGLHFAAALQKIGVLTIVLPYETGNTQAWGMIQAASSENSVSDRVQAQAAQGGKNLDYLRAEVYEGYRNLGWAPLVVLDQEIEEEEAQASHQDQAQNG